MVSAVDFALHLCDNLVYCGSIRELGVITDCTLQDGRDLAAITSHIVLLSCLGHDEPHPPHPSVRLVLSGHALRMLPTLKQYLLRVSSQL